ncbi:MAG: hypothetical protein U0L84_00030 [Acutalibacteraceae bacterium]|nr:hypothetical protein [Acutalibacteraceae bacterium]
MKHLWNEALLDGKWELYYDKAEKAYDLYCATRDALAKSELKKIAGSVPGNFELDMLDAGLIEDPFYADNVLALQELEDTYLWYATTFTADIKERREYFLLFEGIDTFGEIYLNGEKIGESDNALVPFEFEAKGLKCGENELVVKITPDFIEARKHRDEFASTDNIRIGSLNIRKAPHTYGWDIMPRIVSGGIWRSVKLVEKPLDRIDDFYLYTDWIYDNKCALTVKYNVTLSGFRAKDYEISVYGECGDSNFSNKAMLWHTTGGMGIKFDEPKLWWPRGMGDPNLYKVTAELSYKGEVVDRLTLNHGIRKIKLDRTDVFDSEGNGKFQFYINEKPFFAFGTNWVPIDAFHSRDRERLPRALEMVDDIGCNIIRCWGGNVYEDDIFYDFCDSHGITVWQDFGMACASYPQSEYFCNALRREAVKIVRRLRQHPSIIVWAGDNECDESVSNPPTSRNPDHNLLTRKVLPEVLYSYDPMRPYMPSSPHMSWQSVITGQRRNTPEQHVWGPRDYYKGKYYGTNKAIFASETGYHGCNSPESVKKFISPENLWPWNKEHNWDNPEWLVHATCAYTSLSNPYAYRIKLMADQVKTLTGDYTDNLKDFAFASQVSQGEAKKFFIERMRAEKGKRTGIIWWNLIDGWPQFSDAVVDYYYVKKIAYNYIKNSQSTVCLMFREPKDGFGELVAVNEQLNDVKLSYTVTALSSETVVASGTAVLGANANATLLHNVPMSMDNFEIFHIKWQTEDGVSGENHYTCGHAPFDIGKYRALMEKTDILKLEGFEE